MVLQPGVRHRCTITSEDSSSSDAKLGTLQYCAHVLLHMQQLASHVMVCDGTDTTYGREFTQLLYHLGNRAHPDSLKQLDDLSMSLRRACGNGGGAGKLGVCMELQIHGAVQLDEDVVEASLVASTRSIDADPGILWNFRQRNTSSCGRGSALGMAFES